MVWGNTVEIRLAAYPSLFLPQPSVTHYPPIYGRIFSRKNQQKHHFINAPRPNPTPRPAQKHIHACAYRARWD